MLNRMDEKITARSASITPVIRTPTEKCSPDSCTDRYINSSSTHANQPSPVLLQLTERSLSSTISLLLISFVFDPLHPVHLAMATKYHSGSGCGAGAMRASLVLMLLLGAVVAAHGRPVSCENKCGKPIEVNGITVDAYASVTLDVLDVLEVVVWDAANVRLFGSFFCPADVTAVVLVYEEGFVKLKVVAVGIISKLLHTVVGLVLGAIKCVL